MRLTALILTSFFTLSAVADPIPVLQSSGFVNLSVDSSTITINFPLNGQTGKRCGIALRTNRSTLTSGEMLELTQRIQISEGFARNWKEISPRMDASGLSYEFIASNVYMTLVTIEARDLHPLKVNFQEVFSKQQQPESKEVQVIATRVECR